MQNGTYIKGYLWGQLTLFGEAEIIGFGSLDFKVKQIPRNKANAMIQKNHYSHGFCAASYIHLGIFVDSEIVGCLQYGYPMNPASVGGVVSGTKVDEAIELNRLWIKDGLHKNIKSMAISHSIKFIKRKYPKIAWIQSFADERCQKYGIMYQASNFKYYGEHKSVFWEINGHFYHNSQMTRDPNSRPQAKFVQSKKDVAIKHTLRQFRYLYFIKRQYEKNVLLKEMPYPKHYNTTPNQSFKPTPNSGAA